MFRGFRRCGRLAIVLVTCVSATALAGINTAKPICAGCHPKETESYARNAMSHSLVAPEPLPPGRVADARANAVLMSEQRDGRMIHSLEEQGLQARHPVRFQIGAGSQGRTYLVESGKYLFESPLSHFSKYGWDLSPGYASNPVVDFDRVVDEQCLRCHSSGAEFTDADRHQLKTTDLSAITCDRCHGASDLHVQHPSRNNIVNPARLSGAQRDSVCEQCHLEGATRILNPQKTWSDFQPGQATEETFATYVLKGGTSADVMAVSHAEQLAESKCLRGSAGKLWCGTCHNPHNEAADTPAQMKAVCTSCHATLSATAHPQAVAECTSCHMPKSATTDIPHAAITDHRILRRPAPPTGLGDPLRLQIWREPAPELHARDLGLAEIFIGFSKHLQAVGEDGVTLLQSLPEQQIAGDAEVLSDLEGLAMQSNELSTALAIGKRVTELRPDSAKAALNYALVLKQAGDVAEAEHHLKRAIELDPSLKQAYSELAMLYSAQQKKNEMLETLDRYLKFNPQDILFRLQRARAGP